MGSSVDVHCQTAGETFTDAGADLGYVAFGPDGEPERRTTIKWEQCRALASFTRSEGIEASRDQMIAVHVLTHEAMHMSGVRSEAESECRAMQRDARMARLMHGWPVCWVPPDRTYATWLPGTGRRSTHIWARRTDPTTAAPGKPSTRGYPIHRGGLPSDPPDSRLTIPCLNAAQS